MRAAASAWTERRERSAPWTPPDRPTLVLTPHPDDEVLMFGGLIARQLARGVPVTVVAVTDGEGGRRDHTTPAALAATRRREQERAIARLAPSNGPGASIVHLGHPDGQVTDTDVAASLQPLLDGHGLIAAPWSGEPHPDHAACGRAAGSLAERSGTPLALGLFWTWHWLPPEVVTGTLRHLPLSAEVVARRSEAILAHDSQVRGTDDLPALLGPDELAPMRWRDEYVLIGRSGAR